MSLTYEPSSEPQDRYVYDKFGDRWSKLTFIICTTPNQFENNYLAEMFSGSEAGSYLRLIDF